MPKTKTKRGAAKRFKITGTGKVKRSRAYMRHILTHKSRKQKRHLGKPAIASPSDEKSIKRMLPYG
jgi:large subunit ribosomal protein L35